MKGDPRSLFTREAQDCDFLFLEDKMEGSLGSAWGEFQGLGFAYVYYKGDT